ncbi:MAG: ferritin family protein [Dehalococcoidales bacterium]|nr:ferritin family protein [Dehalococcoidales bacterium]
MSLEQERTQAVLKTAIKMEIDGKEFYQKASKKSSSELGKTLLAQLAGEEDIHRKKFEKIFDAIAGQQDWPKTDYQPDGGKALRTVFAKATEKLATSKAAQTELDAVQTAVKMEARTYDYYSIQSKNAASAPEKEFYDALIAQEHEHQLVLLDYYEYLKDPGSWFVKQEHPSIDGG